MNFKISIECNDNNMSNKETFTLCDDLTILFDDYIFTLPKNFKSDGYSSPTELYKKAIRCGLLHDYLYSIHYENNRKLCDQIFLKAMLNAGLPKHRAYYTYYAVRVGGKKAWDKCKN